MTAGPSLPQGLLDSLRQSLVALGEIGGNHLLGYDEIALGACAELRGRCIAIRVTDLDFTLYVHPGDWGIRLGLAPPPGEPDAAIAGRLGSLLSLVAREDKVSTSIGEGVRFSGDVALAQRLQSVLLELDVDWEEMLARRSGDIAAFQLSQALLGLRRQVVAGVDSLLRGSSEYLREEARLTPTRPEFERFRARLAELRNDVARAEARLDRLAGRRGR